jgi:hypothetical protein
MRKILKWISIPLTAILISSLLMVFYPRVNIETSNGLVSVGINSLSYVLAADGYFGGSVESADEACNVNILFGSRYQNNVATGNITKIRVYADYGNTSHDYRMGVYSDSSGEPGSILSANNIVVDIADGWTEVSGLSIPVTSGTYYWLVFMVSARSTYVGYGTSGTGFYKTYTYGNLPASVGTHSNTTTNWMIQAYVVESVAAPSISVSPISYDFGTIQPSSTTNTTGNYFTITNNSTISTNSTIQMLASTWTSSGSGWTHSDNASGVNTVAVKVSTDNGTTWSASSFVKYNAPYNTVWTNLAAASSFKFGLSLLAPTSFNDGASNNNTIRITAFQS